MKENILRNLYHAYVSNTIRKEHLDVETDQVTRALINKKKRISNVRHNGATRSA